MRRVPRVLYGRKKLNADLFVLNVVATIYWAMRRETNFICAQHAEAHAAPPEPSIFIGFSLATTALFEMRRAARVFVRINHPCKHAR